MRISDWSSDVCSSDLEGAIRYASPQSVTRSGDWLIVETDAAESPPSELHGVIKTGPHKGLILTAKPGEVPSAGTPIADVGQPAAQEAVSFSAIGLTLAGALVGGLLVNCMPCDRMCTRRNSSA